MTDEGFFLFITGKRVARKLASLEDKFGDHVITVTRHGAEGDTNAKYEVVATKDQAKHKALTAIAKQTFSKEAMTEAMEEAATILDR